MKFNTPINFTLLTDLLKSYGDVDEIVFKSHSSLDEHRIAEICRESGRLSGHLQLHHPGRNAIEIAAQLGISVQKDTWEIAGGKVIYFGECSHNPSVIRLNAGIIRQLSELMNQWAGESERQWFSEDKILDVAAAHELYHLIEHHVHGPAAELGAHSFARQFTGLPFSPLLYHVLLSHLSKGEGFKYK